MLRSKWRTRGSWRVEAEQGMTNQPNHHGRHPRRPRALLPAPPGAENDPQQTWGVRGLAASANLTAPIVIDDDGDARSPPPGNRE